MNDLNYQLEAVNFEGPLSLILTLLSKNKIAIRDISVSQILEQYLEQIDSMQKVDMEVASEFVQMAAYLLYLKTKTLLNVEEEVSELELLMESLEKLKAKNKLDVVREVLPVFEEKLSTNGRVFTRSREQKANLKKKYEYSHTKEELFHCLYTMFMVSEVKIPSRDSFVESIPRQIIYSVNVKCRELVSLLSLNDKMKLSDIFSMASSKTELVASFIAILELCSVGSAVLEGEDGEESLRLVVEAEKAIENSIDEDEIWK